MVRKFGLIGYPLEHSFSPGYFAAKFLQENITDATYKAYPLKHIEEINELFNTGMTGLNVTIPYKEKVIEYLDQLDEASSQIKAVNTIWIKGSKKLGFNTDVYGFEMSLQNFLDREKVKKALILGTGGSSKAVQWVLEKKDIEVCLVSRQKGYVNYQDIDRGIMKKHTLIVNTTPLGMHPHTDLYPEIPYQFISEQHFCFDLIYNPEKTIFLTRAEVQGSRICNGLEMLSLQAEKSWEIWNQK